MDESQSALFARRVVFVTGTLDNMGAMRASAQIMSLDADGSDAIEIYLDIPRADLPAALVLMDTLDLVHVPVLTHCLGTVAGAALAVLVSGTHRTATPNATFQMTEPSMSIAGGVADILMASAHQRRLVDRLHERIARATYKPLDTIAEDMGRGRYLDAESALDYGLIHAIAKPGQGAGPDSPRNWQHLTPSEGAKN